jgi:tRNA A-37 threonylcarbamoyl transferase component Bud32/tetratricopeptide (TPR) repeat protein
MSTGTPDRDDKKTVRVGSKPPESNTPDATFIASPDAPNTVSGAAGETLIGPSEPVSPAELREDSQQTRPPQVLTGSGSLSAETLVGQVHLTPGKPEVVDSAGLKAAGIDAGSQPTFISSEFVEIPSGTTVIRPEAKKDSEDYFETVTDELDSKTGKPVRGLVVGDYQIVSELGRGGMGVVYKARHRKLNRLVALKMILSGRHTSNDSLERFIAEARAVAKLQHPGIVQIFDIGEHDGLPYFSLEFVEGKDLQKDLNGLPRAPRRCAEMVEQLAVAMQYAHDHRILHRDLKPANILLDKDGRPKISDFGLAKVVDDEGSGATSDGTIMGSPSYMPPEQARGQQKAITAKSDVYSLGAILYQMLTARPPFVSERPLDTVMQVINNDPVMPRNLQPDVPVDLETICMKSLQKDPSARYGSCAELAADLRRFINGEPILARPVSRLERVWRWCKRNPKVAVPSGLAGVFIFLTAVISSWAWNASAAAAVLIAKERDNVKEQRDEAERQKGIAIANEAKAQQEKEEADRQRILASEAKLQAEKNEELARTQAILALKNIQFIVTDIDDQLAKQPGMSELRIEMLKMLEKKWDDLDVQLTGGIRGTAIATLMTVRFKIAEAWISLGKLAEADATLAKIYEQGKQRIVDQGRIDATRSNLAQICLKWAPVRQRLTGNPLEGERLLDEALVLLRDIIAHPLDDPKATLPGPAKWEIASTLQGTLQQLASARKKRGSLDAASAVFTEAEKVSEDILADIERKSDWVLKLPDGRLPLIKSFFQQNVDLCRTGRANVLCSLGKVDESIPVYQAVIQSRRAAVEANPTDRNAKDQLALQLRNFGQYMLRCGKIEEGAASLAEAAQIAESLYNEDSKNAFAKRNAGYGFYYLGTARDLQGHADEALALFERARVVRTELQATSKDTSSKVDLMLAEARLGNLEAAKVLIDDLSTTEAKNPDLRLDIARALAQLSRRAEGDAKNDLTTQAFAALDRCVADGLIDPFPVANEVDLIPLRDDDRFRAIVARLQDLRTQAEQPATNGSN